MKLAALFWFYKQPEVSGNHLQLLKKHNPELPVFGLFGGPVDQQKMFQEQLTPNLDDFYTSPFTNPDWKWLNGDLVLLDWYDKRGRHLEWDSLAIVQWDTLVLDPLSAQFPDLKPGQIFLSGLRELDADTEAKWDWTDPRHKERQDFLNFTTHIEREYGHKEKLLCCLFIFAIFPRVFFTRYQTVKNKEIGFLEYKLPTYAKILGIPFYQKDIGVLWFEKDIQKPLNAIPQEIPTEYIKKQIQKPNGWRIFHPYFQTWP